MWALVRTACQPILAKRRLQGAAQASLQNQRPTYFLLPFQGCALPGGFRRSGARAWFGQRGPTVFQWLEPPLAAFCFALVVAAYINALGRVFGDAFEFLQILLLQAGVGLGAEAA